MEKQKGWDYAYNSLDEIVSNTGQTELEAFQYFMDNKDRKWQESYYYKKKKSIVS